MPSEPTFLFTDIVGSTPLWELHPGRMPDALAQHDAIVRGAIERAGGRVFSAGGDAFQSAFDRPAQALTAALSAQRALIATDWGELGSLDARMALHKGPARQRDGNFFGQSLNRCARLLAAGHGRQILLSDAVRLALADNLPADLALRDLGQHRLRDLRLPERVYQVQATGLPPDFPRLRTLDTLPNNLPIQRGRFIGREQALQDLRSNLAQARLLSLVGPGGSGKTRLALQLAADSTDDFEQGAWLVELAGLKDARWLPQVVATTLGVPDQARAGPRRASRALDDLEQDRWLQRLVGYLESKELLLILDNCEHMVSAAADLADAILLACPRLTLLATSREALAVEGEQVYRVPPLRLPEPEEERDLDRLRENESVQLFLNRARAIRPGFELDARSAEAIVQICRRLDGIPLAIELAAGRLSLLSPEQILERLDDRFKLLRGGRRSSLPHQQTLRATLDWSHDLLEPGERTLLRRLAAFRGSFELEAAEAICADPDATASIDGEAVVDRLSGLVDKSLLRVLDTGGRFRMLSTLRQYAGEKLDESGEARRLQAAHLAWYLLRLRSIEPWLRGHEQVRWLDWLAAEHANLRAALAWALAPNEAEATLDPDAGLRLVGELWWFWMVRGYLAEGRAWLERAIAAANAEPSNPPEDATRLRSLALAQLGAGALAWRQTDYGAAAPLLERSAERFEQASDPIGLARARHYEGRVLQDRGDYEAALLRYEASRALAAQAGATWVVASNLDIMGLNAWHRGDLDQASAYLERSLSLAQEIGDLQGAADSLNILGRVAHDRGDFDAAHALYSQSLETYEQLGDRLSIAYSLNKLGNVARHRGRQDEAERLLEQSLVRCRELGEKRGQAYALSGLGNLARARGDLDLARDQLQQSLGLARGIGDRRGIADALRNLGWLAEQEGDPSTAFVLHCEAAERYLAMGDRLGIAEALAGVATAQSAAAPGAAAELFAAAEALRESLGTPLPEAAAEHQRGTLLALERRMGDAAFAEAWEEGRAGGVTAAIQAMRALLVGSGALEAGTG